MRWVTYPSPDGADRAGLVVNDVVHGPNAPSLDLLGDLATAGQRARSAPAETLPLAEVCRVASSSAWAATRGRHAVPTGSRVGDQVSSYSQ
jgi:hypothetical protein